MLKFIMSLLPETVADLTEIVLCDSGAAMQAHRELFRFSRNAYLPVYESDGNACDALPSLQKLVEACNASPACPARIHVAAGWENILRVAAWKADLASVNDIFIVLRNAGVMESELKPFAGSQVADLFPFFYYGKRLDVLKRLCRIACRQIESRIRMGGVRADCHLILEDAPRIVASSL
ncbi:MAG TPA: hypothetical protein VMB78_04180 [Dissulfurispiraceae bacterium]|nr:hypothetical protein [Dissulfurispiraceae bacterium]